MQNEAFVMQPTRYFDDRGWFMETYSRQRLHEDHIDLEFVQDNHSYSRHAGTVRGFHFQVPPYEQAKIVRCIRGSILDVAVDLRAGSSSYGKYFSAELTAADGTQMFVPIGFGHAFMTLEPDTEVTYKVSSAYMPRYEGGVRWDDARIAVEWPLFAGGAKVSQKDWALATLDEFESPFVRPDTLTTA